MTTPTKDHTRCERGEAHLIHNYLELDEFALLSSTPTSSNMLFHSLLASLALAATVSASSKRPADFVYTDGENFAVNGQKFYFFGTNAYWFSFLDNITDVSIAMDNAKAAGIKVVRTWGFRDLNTTYVPGGLPQYGDEGAGASTIYYQSWTDGKPTINYGPNGLQRLDKVVQLAEKKGLKLILALTNNWVCHRRRHVSLG